MVGLFRSLELCSPDPAVKAWIALWIDLLYSIDVSKAQCLLVKPCNIYLPRIQDQRNISVLHKQSDD